MLATTATATEMPRVFITGGETADSSNSKDKAEGYVDFTGALHAAILKKELPVLLVSDEAKATYRIVHSSTQREDSTGTKIAKMAFGFGAGGAKFEGTISVEDIESSAIVFAYNVKKGNFQSAAESFAKKFKDFLKDQAKREGR